MRQDESEMRWERIKDDDKMKYSENAFYNDEIQRNAFYNDEVLMRQEYIWVTFESNLSELHLNQIWVRQSKMKMRHDRAKCIL